MPALDLIAAVTRHTCFAFMIVCSLAGSNTLRPDILDVFPRRAKYAYGSLSCTDSDWVCP